MSEIIYLKKYLGSNKEVVVAKAFITEGKIKLEGDKEIISMLESGIVDPRNKIKLVYPKDGEVFLQAMLNYFDSPYLFATNKLKIH